jgi:hypothetical protein
MQEGGESGLLDGQGGEGGRDYAFEKRFCAWAGEVVLDPAIY